MQLFLKIPCEMANSSDPDQTASWGAVWSDSALLAYVILLETLLLKSLDTYCKSHKMKSLFIVLT